MPFLFFFIIVLVPFSVGLQQLYDVTEFHEYVGTFFVPAVIIGYLFRVREVGRAYVVSLLSFEMYPAIALAAGLASLSGSLIGQLPIIGVPLGIAAIASAVAALSDGPVYGWDP